jgi:ABC-2 type transport system ATP-binding protein
MEVHAVLYGLDRKVARSRIEELMRLVELWDRKDDLVGKFSGGMKRRLEIARGLLHHPKVLFLDEPTLGLDPQTRNHMWNYVKSLNDKEQITVFLTTHYMEEAERVAGRIAIIDHGKIITEGTAAELKSRTQTDNLEDAFLKLTGSTIRPEEVSSGEQMRAHMRLHR